MVDFKLEDQTKDRLNAGGKVIGQEVIGQYATVTDSNPKIRWVLNRIEIEKRISKLQAEIDEYNEVLGVMR